MNIYPMEVWRANFQDFLEKRFEEIKSKNPRFSIRAYARMAKISAAGMSSILKKSNKWKLSPSRAVDIFEKIGASPQAIKHLVALTGEIPKYEMSRIEDKDYDILTRWEHLAVLFSFDLAPQLSPGEIAKRFDLPLQEIERIIADLLNRKLLRKDKDGNVTRDPDQHYITSDNVPSEIIRRHHLSNLEVVARAVKTMPTEQRDITSMTFTGDVAKLEQVRQEIRNCYQRIFAIMDDGENRNEVFKIVVGVAPIHFSGDEK